MESEKSIKYSKNEILAIKLKAEESSFYLLKLSNDFLEDDSELRGTSFIKSTIENKKVQFKKSRLARADPKSVLASVFSPKNSNTSKIDIKVFFLNEENYNEILKAGNNKAFNLPSEQQEEKKEEIPKKRRGPKKKSTLKIKDEVSKDNNESEEEEDMNLGPYKKIKLTEKTSKNQKKPKKNEKGSRGQGRKGNQPQVNDSIQIIPRSLQLESGSSDLDKGCCLHCTMTELSRCLLTSNTELLSQILDCCSFNMSSLFHNPNPSYFSNSPVFILFEKQNINLVDMCLSLKDQLFTIISNNNFNSKRNNRYQYKFDNGAPLPPWGYTANLHEARGGKQGNTAFWENQSSLAGNIIEKIIEKFDNIQIFESFRAKLKSFESFIFNEVPTIVRAGNRKLASYLIKEKLDFGGYGYNKFHFEALAAERLEDVSPFKKMNLMKKTMGEKIVTPMHCAAINPNAEILRAFIDLSGELGVPDEKQRKLVHYAAACEGVGPLKMLIEEKMVDSREADSLKNTALMIACNFNRVENVRFLLEKDERSNISAKNKKGYAAIHFAAENGNISILKILLSHNADINFPGPNKMTALHLAAQNNHMECVEFLLENGAKLNAKDKYKRNSLILAIKNGNLKISSYLLRKGVAIDDPDSSKNYAIHYAAAYGFYECIELLMKAGADPNVKSSWNLCPLIIALQKSHPRCIKTLLSFPLTDVNCKDETGRTLISQAVEHLDDHGLEHLTFLIEVKKADINIKDLKGWSALHYACSLTAEKVSRMRNFNFEKENEEIKKESLIESEKIILKIIELFCKNGANMNEESNDHLFPISIALKNNYKIADLLLSQNTLDLTKISIADTCVFHDLAGLLKYKEGRDLFYKIIGIFHQQNLKIDNLVNLVDNLGFTPLLKIIQVYSLCGKTLLSEKINFYISQNEKEKNAFPQAKQNNPLFAPQKQLFPTKPLTAPRKLQMRAMPAKAQPAFFPGLNDPVPKNKVENELTAEEKKEFIQKAYQDYLQENMEFLTLLNDFIKLGADPYIQVDRLKKYREDETLLQKEIDEQNEILKKNPNAPKKRITPYGDCGKQGFLHFILMNPSEEILKNFGNLNLQLLINMKDDQERTPLHFYVNCCEEKNEYDYLYKNNIEILRELLSTHEIQLQTDEPDLEGNTPIMNAVFNQKLVFAELLRNLGKAEINRTNKIGYVPLVKWVKEKHLKNVERTLLLGASPNFEDGKRRNALHYAVNFANFDADASFEMEALLLRHGASINSVDKNGRTPLHYAFVKIGSPFDNLPIDPVETVSGLLGSPGININIKDRWGKTPLHYAAQRGSNVCGIYLLNSKAEIDSLDEEKNTPLGIAFKNMHQNFVSLLIQNKASINLNFFYSQPEKKKENSQPRKPIFGGGFGLTSSYNNNYIQNNIDSDVSSESSDDDSKKKINSNTDSDDSESDTFSFAESEQEFKAVQTNNNKFAGAYPINNFNNFNFNNTNVRNNQNLEANKHYTYFNAAIKYGWQGIAYLLIQQGYNLLTAIEAAFQEKKFRLVLTILNKRSDPESFSGVNVKNQNFFHILALFGKEMDEETLIKICDDLIFKGVKTSLRDHKGRTPLHYASHTNFFLLVKKLVLLDQSGKSILEEDKFGLKPFSFSLLSENVNFNLLDFFLENGEKINELIKIKGKIRMTTPLLLAISKGEKNLSKIKWYLERGSSINEKDEDGISTIIYAIRINSRKLVDFIITHKDFDAVLHIDNNKKTPIHHVVTPLELGSFENIKILNLLAAKFNVNDKDSFGREPLFYASQQDSGIMANELIRLGAEKKVNVIKRCGTSVISRVEWVEQYDFEGDAEKYVALQKEEENNKEKTEEKVEVDKNCEDSINLEVFSENGTFYDVLLTKVDLQKGFFGLNVFYKFQLLYDKNRDLYILFTRWGSIGSTGQFQRSPYESKDEAIEQFKKLYLSKTANEWSKIGTFEKKQNKYQLIKTVKKKSLKEILKPFDLKSADLPHINIPKRIAKVMQVISDVKIYSEGLKTLNVNTDYLPLSSLNKELLIEAKEILSELSELIKTINEATKNFKNANAANILKLRETIALKSSRYFELIPSKNYQDNMIIPIDNEHLLRQNLAIIESLIDFEVSAKILLSAHFNIKTINPLDYIYNGLGIRMMCLETEDPEYKIIWRYINNSHKIRPKFVKNIFALERKNEAERISKHKNLSNKMLLWHGSNIQNFMGILGQGLRIAPPTSNINGHAFGKGVYLADMFEKSWHYSCYQREKYIFMLLCETALGNMLELNNFQYIDRLDAQYDSVLGKGKIGPNFKQNMYLANGCSIPIGKVIDYSDQERYLAHNEYVVYDESQIRIRYLVQINKKYNEK